MLVATSFESVHQHDALKLSVTAATVDRQTRIGMFTFPVCLNCFTVSISRISVMLQVGGCNHSGLFLMIFF
jgi:hypothetical protein